jgi:hypothetical protein
MPTRAHTPNRRAALVSTLLAGAALALGACGDDDETTTDVATTTQEPATGPDGVSSTTLDPGAPPGEIPELPTNDDPSAVQCTGPPEGVFDATAVIGESVEDAMEAAADEGCQVRVTVEDGKPLAATQDFRPDRVNVAVKDGEVVRIESLG